MVSLYNIVATITMIEMGYGCEPIVNCVRREAGFRRHGAPFGRRSVAFVYRRGNRRGYMKEERRPGPPRLSTTRNMSVAG